MLARLNYAKLSSNYQEFNQSYALLAGRSKLLPSLTLKRGTGLPPSLDLSKGNVGKALVQKREQGTAPEWHGKICRMRSSRKRPTD